MKKIILILIICSVVCLSGFALLNRKTDWRTEMESYGSLNIMEMDEKLDSNEFYSFYNIDSKKDVIVSNNILISKGTVEFVIFMNGTLLYEKKFDVGEYTIDTEEISDAKGELAIEMKASDDVQGTYSIKVNTREKKWYHLQRQIKELFD